MTVRFIAGVDEAGRGPLAGPVAVGVFMLPHNYPKSCLAKVRDSKQLSESVRERLYDQLIKLPKARWAVALVGPSAIDSLGINGAIKLAILRALKRANIPRKTTCIMLDGGLKAPQTYPVQRTIVKGDQKMRIIGAASILAKVTRDRHMKSLDRRLPEYGFDTHKGYGTRHHVEQIQRVGLSRHHRKSFCRNVKR